MSDIFQEVDEEVRRDKALEFWKKHQNKMIAAAVLIVLLTSGYRFYEYRRDQAAAAAGAAFEEALELDRSGKSAEAAEAFTKIAAEAPAGYQALARLAKAASLAKSDVKAALVAYDAFAADQRLDPLMQSAAKLKGALLRLDNGEADKAEPTLEALAGPGQPFRNSAREALGAMALAKGDYDGAGKWLDAVVSDADAPQQAKRNAEQLLGLVAANRPAQK